jgi:hypothetical protein
VRSPQKRTERGRAAAAQAGRGHRRSMAEHGGAWRSMAEHGEAWGSMAKHGGAWRSMAEHGEHGGAWRRAARVFSTWLFQGRDAFLGCFLSIIEGESSTADKSARWDYDTWNTAGGGPVANSVGCAVAAPLGGGRSEARSTRGPPPSAHPRGGGRVGARSSLVMPNTPNIREGALGRAKIR